MKRKQSYVPIVGAQSFFFAIGMYLIALFFSLFFFSALFNALNHRQPMSKDVSDPLPTSKSAKNGQSVS